jgi:hypothetical protein
MLLQEPAPASVLRLLDERGLNGQPVLLTTASDLSLDGQLQRCWFVVNGPHLAVLADGSAIRLLCSLTINQVETFRAHGVIGSGFLQARLDGVWVDLLRYSNSLANRFTKVAAKLEEFRTTGQLRIQDDDSPTACPNPLPKENRFRSAPSLGSAIPTASEATAGKRDLEHHVSRR